jgi:cyclopropane fatty-acyl-phospholipid synthase-like methyltransferase
MIKDWWSEKSGFFGKFYMTGDNSIDGYHEFRKMNMNERTLEEVEGVIRLCKLKKGEKILDCPCGWGRHSIGLAKYGLVVIGSDLNSFELNIANKQSADSRLNVKFIKENMLNLKYKNEFDAIINMWYSFGFFDTDKENLKVLKNFYNSLKYGGKFLMHTDVNIPRVLKGKFREYEKRRLSGGGFLRQVEFCNPQTKRNNGIWIIEKIGKVESKSYSIRVYTKEEFTELCTKVGFRDVKVYSDWHGKKYTKDSEDMIIVATK